MMKIDFVPDRPNSIGVFGRPGGPRVGQEAASATWRSDKEATGGQGAYIFSSSRNRVVSF